MLATFILVQFPFAGPVYFFYLAPLVVLCALAGYSLSPSRLRAPAMLLYGFLFLFAVVWVRTAALFPTAQGRYEPRQAMVRFDLERGGIRVLPSERAEYEEALLAGELVTPPAGAIGRGDAFILQIAGKVGATVLSNDSFQELHAVHPWLFDEGRLIGGKPVPGVGWVFLLRTPVRGPVSRRATSQARGRDRSRPSPTAPPAETESSSTGRRRRGQFGEDAGDCRQRGLVAEQQDPVRLRRRTTAGAGHADAVSGLRAAGEAGARVCAWAGQAATSAIAIAVPPTRRAWVMRTPSWRRFIV